MSTIDSNPDLPLPDSNLIRNVFRRIPAAIGLLDGRNSQIIDATDEYLTLVGAKREDLIGRTLPAFLQGCLISPDSLTSITQSLDRAHAEQQPQVLEGLPFRRAGTKGDPQAAEPLVWNVASIPVSDANKNVSLILHYVEDVTELALSGAISDPAAKGKTLAGGKGERVRHLHLPDLAERLRRQQTLLAMASKVSRLGAWSYDLRAERLEWSDELRVILEVDPQFNPTVDTALSFYIDNSRQRIEDAFGECCRSGRPFDLELLTRTANGRQLWVRALGEAVRDSSGSIVRVEGAFQDIDDVCRARHREQELRDQIGQTLDQIAEGFLLVERDWRIAYVNTAARSLLRLGSARIEGLALWEAFPDAVGSIFDQQYRQALETQQAVEFEAHYAAMNRWFEVRAYPVARGLAIYFADITTTRDYVTQLQISEERFRLLAEATSDCVWDWDFKTSHLWWSEGLTRLFGFGLNEVDPTIDSWYERIHPNDLDWVDANLRSAMAKGDSEWSAQYRFLRKDGHYAIVIDRARILRDETGEVIRLVGGMIDITDRVQAEQRLADQAELINSANDAIIVRSLDNRVSFWSRGAVALYGWSVEEALGQPIYNLIYDSSIDLERHTRQVLIDGRWSGELAHRTKDGRTVTVLGRWTLLRDPSGNPKSILAINSDVTDLKKLQTHVLRIQRMESIGTLTSGIAHDFNNMLTPILMGASTLSNANLRPELADVVKTLRTSAERAADLVRQLLRFAHGEQTGKSQFNPLPVLAEVHRMARDTFDANIRIELEAPPTAPTLYGSPTELHQILMNLCVNSRDAMPHGGRILLALETEWVDDALAHMNEGASPGLHIVIRVEDNGTGMSHAVLERIYEPFFTTKEPGKGTGLGLYTVFSIVRRHAGFVHVYSEEGKGSRFKVYLPVATADQPAASQPSYEPIVLPRGGGELILLVDDEEDILTVTCNALERSGYRVLTAANGAEAVATFAVHKDHVAVVLTDMSMPVMDGPATIVALKAIRPDVVVIGASGLAANGHVAKATAAGVTHFLPKPYALDALLKTVHEALSSRLSHAEANVAPPSIRAKRILVVEDEPMVLEMVIDVLSAQGYEVKPASTFAAAEALCSNAGFEPDLLLTDLQLGRRTGEELFRQLSDFRPNMRVLYVSGDYRDAAVGVAPEHFLAKPFSLEVLVERVQQALGER